MLLEKYADHEEYYTDIDKIVYSNPYKRLAHKTQIIIKPTRDHFRSRLTHTEEVNQIALSLGRRLKLNMDLITAIVRAHDLGHTAFGHAGERTLQQVIEREIVTRFKMNIPKTEPARSNFRKSIFHHSLNSARMLIKEQEFYGISFNIINGVLTHSWSPWKENGNHAIPESYEAQAVAIADQIASINHDTEDIIEGHPYTEYDKDRFSRNLIEGFRSKYPNSYMKIGEKILSLIVDNHLELGYGRQKRIETFVSAIVDFSAENIRKNNVSDMKQAVQYPLCIIKEWGEFLNYYERFIRDLIQEKIPWFIARDNMAGALISTVFNHIWPRVRNASSISKIPFNLFDESVSIKSRQDGKTKYIYHFQDFFMAHYDNEEMQSGEPTTYKKYLIKAKDIHFQGWDINIFNALKQKPTPEEYQNLIRLIAVIDFIAGLTDRYCLEMFNEVYQEFVIT